MKHSNVNEYKIKETLIEFIQDFETVFDTDWEFTSINMKIGVIELLEMPKEARKLCREISKNMEVIYVIADDGTFLYPKLTENELKIANWEKRDELLNLYREIKEKL